MSLERDIAKFAIKSNKNVEQVRRGVILKLFAAVINDTPVDTGRLRGNWQTSVRAPAKGVKTVDDKSGSLALSKLFSYDFTNKDAFLTNNLPYARVAEYGEWSGPTSKVTGKGYSRKSPAGMVRKNTRRFRLLIQKQIKKLT